MRQDHSSIAAVLPTPLASTAIPPEGDGERFGLLVDNRVEFEE